MSDQIFKVKCVDCGEKHEIVSPAHLICQKCGSGQLEFKNAVIFKCHKGHEQRGKIVDEVCKECFSFEQRPFRNFESLKPAKLKAPPDIPDDGDDEDDVEDRLEKEAELVAKKKKRTKAKKEKAAVKKQKHSRIKTRKK